MQADKKEGGEGEYEGRMKWGRNRRGARIEIRRQGKNGFENESKGLQMSNPLHLNVNVIAHSASDATGQSNDSDSQIFGV